MSKVTSKLQVTLPKAIADQYGIRPGDDIDWLAAGDAVRVVPSGVRRSDESIKTKLRLFDQATERIRRHKPAKASGKPAGRGWTREDLYVRGRAH